MRFKPAKQTEYKYDEMDESVSECPRCKQMLKKAERPWYRCVGCGFELRDCIVDSLDSWLHFAERDSPLTPVCEVGLRLDSNGELQDLNLPAYIYLIESDEGLVKIGRSKNPEQRLRQLSTGSPSELELVQSVEVAKPVEAENKLHNEYSEYRVSGEWFELPENKYEELINRLTLLEGLLGE